MAVKSAVKSALRGVKSVTVSGRLAPKHRIGQVCSGRSRDRSAAGIPGDTLPGKNRHNVTFEVLLRNSQK